MSSGGENAQAGRPASAFSAAGETPHQQLRSRKPKRQELSPTERSDLCPPPETSEVQPFMTRSSWAWLPLLRASPLPGSSSRPLSAPDAPSSEPPQHRTEPPAALFTSSLAGPHDPPWDPRQHSWATEKGSATIQALRTAVRPHDSFIL